MPQTSAATIPRRAFGPHTGDQISILGLGGSHIGDAEDEKTAIAIMDRAMMRASTSSTIAGRIIAEKQKTGWGKRANRNGTRFF